MSLRFLAAEALRGKSVFKAQSNLRFRAIASRMTGICADLACGSSPSYRRILRAANHQLSFVGADYSLQQRPDVAVDLLRPLPFADAAFDSAICASFIYIPMRPQDALAEFRRILRPGGLLILLSPFMYPYSPEPTDHWRLTPASLHALLPESGFYVESIDPMGSRFSSCVQLLHPMMPLQRVAGAVLFPLADALDAMARRLRPRWCEAPTGYFVVARATGGAS